MLDTTTKRRIDTARDILVGKVPDPKSQVEQITIALIYKFMDDIDAESEEFGGVRTFFAGDFARYGWPRLVRSGLGGHEILNLYAEAITRMPENPGIPLLFRDIFTNAYLPYRDPETLRAFLKVIDEFEYDHSERLGDAFEYLLSVLGSQGDAGQFRTPRHIIDFIVEVIDPKKEDTILDPACGTAGFLISSYKHILRANVDKQDGPVCGRATRTGRQGNETGSYPSTLTPDEKGGLAANFRGYDISPDMVRLSLVNLYLHGFVEPHIFEYDTLTSEERWNEYADVILANPPFMSPKGGIRPHSRFSMKSKRSEVLFVDYMAEHLTPAGRAGIIVPEGIIFQSQNAHKQLRKMLVENYLVAVISLPAGVFNPYSGVKTSILLLDKALAKRTDRIAFFKVENDGFNLGAQRRPIDKNDLPRVTQAVKEYLAAVQAGMNIAGNMDAPVCVRATRTGRQDMQDKEKSSPSSSSMLQNLIEQGTTLIAEKEKIAAGGEYNLGGERYRENGIRTKTIWPVVELGSVIRILNGYAFKSKNYVADGIRVIRITNVQRGRIVDNDPKFYPMDSEKSLSKYVLNENDLLLSLTGNVGRIGILDAYHLPAALNQRVACLRSDNDKALNQYIFYFLNHKSFEDDCIEAAKGFAQKNLSTVWLSKYEIPLPPLEVQREIVAEIEGYQRVIDGARAVVDNYRPHIPVDPDWPLRSIGDLAQNWDSRRVPIAKASRKEGPFPYYGASGVVDYVDGYIFDDDILLISEDGANLIARSTPIAFSVSGKCWVNNHAHVLKFKRSETQKLVEVYLNSVSIEDFVTGSAQPKLNQQALNSIPVPIPNDIDTQDRIVAEIEAEQALVAANSELIERFEKKIQFAITRVWGENGTSESTTAVESETIKRLHP